MKAKYKQGESPQNNKLKDVGLAIQLQDNYKLDDIKQVLTVSMSYQIKWFDQR